MMKFFPLRLEPQNYQWLVSLRDRFEFIPMNVLINVIIANYKQRRWPIPKLENQTPNSQRIRIGLPIRLDLHEWLQQKLNGNPYVNSLINVILADYRRRDPELKQLKISAAL